MNYSAKILLLISILYSSPVKARIYITQEITTPSGTTFACQQSKCERTSEEFEIGEKFNYTSISTSNSGNSQSKKQYICTATEDGAKCKAKFTN